MPVFPASVNFVVNGNVIDVLPKSLGAFPVMDAFWRVLESGDTGELYRLRCGVWNATCASALSAKVYTNLRRVAVVSGESIVAVWAGLHGFPFFFNGTH